MLVIMLMYICPIWQSYPCWPLIWSRCVSHSDIILCGESLGGSCCTHTHRTCSLMHIYTSQTCDQHVQTGGHAQTTWKDHVTQSNRHTHTHSCTTRPYSNNCTLGTKQSVYTVECMGGIELGHMPIEEVYLITKAAARICPEVSAAHTTLYCSTVSSHNSTLSDFTNAIWRH